MSFTEFSVSESELQKVIDLQLERYDTEKAVKKVAKLLKIDEVQADCICTLIHMYQTAPKCGCGEPATHSHDGEENDCCGGMMCCNRANI